MRTTKVFKSGNSQAVRLPVDFQLDVDEVEILRRRNGDIVIRKMQKNLSQVLSVLSQFPDDCFAAEREDLPPQERQF